MALAIPWDEEEVIKVKRRFGSTTWGETLVARSISIPAHDQPASLVPQPTCEPSAVPNSNAPDAACVKSRVGGTARSEFGWLTEVSRLPSTPPGACHALLALPLPPQRLPLDSEVRGARSHRPRGPPSSQQCRKPPSLRSRPPSTWASGCPGPTGGARRHWPAAAARPAWIHPNAPLPGSGVAIHHPRAPLPGSGAAACALLPLS